jgi:hypothetical protein
MHTWPPLDAGPFVDAMAALHLQALSFPKGAPFGALGLLDFHAED